MTDRKLQAEDVRVGQLVRVVALSEEGTVGKEEQRVGMITMFNCDVQDADFSVDVEFDDPRLIAIAPEAPGAMTMEPLEIHKIPVDRLRQLEAWEQQQKSQYDQASQATSDGKDSTDQPDQDKLLRRAQFLAGRVRDFRSARAILRTMFQNLSGKACSVGGNVVVFEPTYSDRGLLKPAKLGMVATADDESAEVMSTDDDGADIEFIVPVANLIPVPTKLDDALSYIKLALLAAKFALQQKPEATTETVCLCAVVITMCQSLIGGDAPFDGEYSSLESKKAVSDWILDALLLKCRAHVLQNKLTAAAVDVKLAVQRAPSNKQARKLVEIVKQRRVHALKQDRALARSISSWVQTSVLDKEESQDTDSSVNAAGQAQAASTSQASNEDGNESWSSWAKNRFFS
mmetsp:Transcript_21695/g.34816  ORF Transcript_21695/g.34816 Transcript_21695/m.34816 type:complete len:402 (-) Transcript_21695:283-1488(-)